MNEKFFSTFKFVSEKIAKNINKAFIYVVDAMGQNVQVHKHKYKYKLRFIFTSLFIAEVL